MERVPGLPSSYSEYLWFNFNLGSLPNWGVICPEDRSYADLHTGRKIENHLKHINKFVQQNVMRIAYSDLGQLLLQFAKRKSKT